MQTNVDQTDADARLRSPFDPDPKCYLTESERSGAPDASGGSGDAHVD